MPFLPFVVEKALAPREGRTESFEHRESVVAIPGLKWAIATYYGDLIFDRFHIHVPVLPAVLFSEPLDEIPGA
jgi:hypothetical protein